MILDNKSECSKSGNNLLKTVFFFKYFMNIKVATPWTDIIWDWHFMEIIVSEL